MKKLKLLTFAALALAATACSSDDVVDAPADAKTPIAFSPYVDYSIQSRSNDITKENISEFAVYGFYQATSDPSTITKVFDGARVYLPTGQGASGNTEAWECTSTQYWMAGNSYWFCALAPFGGSYTVPFPTTAASTYTGFGDIEFDNSSTGAKAEQDLIYAFNGGPVTEGTPTNSGWASEAETGSTGAGGKTPTGLSGTSQDRVPFTFNHLLSRVRIEITTGDGETSVLRISDLKISEIYTEGKYQTTGDSKETWTDTPSGTYKTAEYAYPTPLYIPGRTETASHTAFTSWKTETGNWAEADSTSLVRYFIPGQSSLKLSFKASFYPKGTTEPTATTDPKYKNSDVTPQVSGIYTATDLEAAVDGNFQKGTAYVIKATINAKTIDSSLTNPIKFTVTEENGVEGWGAETEIDKDTLEQNSTNP